MHRVPAPGTPPFRFIGSNVEPVHRWGSVLQNQTWSKVVILFPCSAPELPVARNCGQRSIWASLLIAMATFPVVSDDGGPPVSDCMT